MDPFANMELHKSSFTQNDQKIYEAIIAKPEQVTYQSTNKLAENLGVSQPALTRFIKMLGYQKYQDFRSDITTWLARREVTGSFKHMTYFERMDQLLKEAEKVLTDEYVTDIARYILKADRIFASGIGKSMNPAYLMQALFRKHERFITPCQLDTLNEVADHISPKDLLVIFSVSAQPEIMERVKATSGSILLITCNAAHNYQDTVSRTVVLPFLPPDPELCSVSPVLFDMFVELLDAAIAKIRSERNE
ncbi:MAG: MurR/RpiR family transcriptional regulator [Bulleidia sp.]